MDLACQDQRGLQSRLSKVVLLFFFFINLDSIIASEPPHHLVY